MAKTKIHKKLLALCIGIAIPFIAASQDYYQASGVPPARGQLNSAELRAEYAAIEDDISNKLPPLAGNANKIVLVNGTGTALTSTDSIPDSALSSNVPLLNAAQLFTDSRAVVVSSGSPQLGLIETDAAADNGYWRLIANGEVFRIQTEDDARTASTSAIDISRTGLTIDQIDLSATALNWNGNTLFTIANDGGGSGLDADLLDGLNSPDFARLAFENTFTAIQELSAAQPILRFNETGVTADEGDWRIEANGEQFLLRSDVDAQNAPVTWFAASRVGTTVTDVSFTSNTLQRNGNTVWDAGNDGTGSGLDADTIDGLDSSNFLSADGNINFTGDNTFAGRTDIASTSAPLWFEETDATANNGKWYVRANGETFAMFAVDDAETTFNPFMAIDRTNAVISQINLTGAALEWNGNTLFTTANDGSGSGLDADLLDGLDSTAFMVGANNLSEITNATTARSNLGLGALATLATVNNANWSGTDLAVANGGTGASDATGARTNLGLGTLATRSTINNSDWSGVQLTVANGGTGATTAAGARTGLGLGSLATLNTINDANWSGTDLAIANGGTGSSTASGARSNLGLAIGSAVQAYDADLSTIAALAKTDGNFIVANGTTWIVESGSTARSSLGLGSLATASSINNSNWSGTDLTVANGGTGSSTAAGAAGNLGLGTANSPQFAAVNINSASDTTVTRVRAGELEVEGRPVLMHDNAAQSGGRIRITNTAPATAVGSNPGDIWLVY